MGFFDKKIEGKTAKEWLNLANSESNPELKIKYCDYAIQADGNLTGAWLEKGDTYSGLKQYRKSLECYLNIIKIFEKSPNNGEILDYINAHRGFGEGALQLGTFQDANGFFDKAIDMTKFGIEKDLIDANSGKEFIVSLYKRKGFCYLLLQQRNEEDKCYDKILEIYPTKIEILLLKASLVKEWLHNPKEAINWYNKILTIEPNNIDALKGLAFCYGDLKQYHQSITFSEKALNFDPINPVLWILKGDNYFELNELEEALTCLKKGVNFDPKSIHASVKIIDINNKLKRYEESIKIYDSLINLYPRHKKFLIDKVDLLCTIGKYSEALNTLQKALEIDPKREDIKENIEKIKKINSSEQKNVEKQIETSSDVKIIIDDKPIEILCIIIKKHNISLITNPPVFTGIIKDYFKGDYKREVKILTTSIEENIPQDLLAKKDKIPFAVLSGQFVQRLEDCGFSKELSVWAVHAWARALGIEKL